MPIVDYPYSQTYLQIPNGGSAPALQIDLIRNDQRISLVGVLDSGSIHTVISHEYAPVLGIEEVREGEAVRASTQAGLVEYFLFDMEIQVRIGSLFPRLFCRVGIFGARRPRNILGRDFFFQHYQIGFRDRAQVIYLRPED